MGLYIHVNFGGSKLNKNLNCDKKKKTYVYVSNYEVNSLNSLIPYYTNNNNNDKDPN